MAAGYLYVLSNPSIPDLAKVGKTTREPAQRAAELSAATGVASPFVLLYQQPVADCDAAEAWVHDVLTARGWRHADNREFFSAPLHEIVALVFASATHVAHAAPALPGTPDPLPTDAADDAPSEADYMHLLALQTLIGHSDVFADRPRGARLMLQAAEMGSIGACECAGKMLMRGEYGLKQDLRKAHGLLAQAIEAGRFDCHALMAELLLLNGQRSAAMRQWQHFFEAAAQHLRAQGDGLSEAVASSTGAAGRDYCKLVYTGRIDDCIDDATFAVLAPFIEAACDAERALWAGHPPITYRQQKVRLDLEMNLVRAKRQRATAASTSN